MSGTRSLAYRIGDQNAAGCTCPTSYVCGAGNPRRARKGSGHERPAPPRLHRGGRPVCRTAADQVALAESPALARAGSGRWQEGRCGAEPVPRGGSAVLGSAAQAAMSSRPRRDDAAAGGARRPREPPEQELQRRREQKRRRHDAQQLQQLKHLESLKMRLSQKTVYQMYQAMNMPGNFWLTRQLKDCGCHWGKKSKLCRMSVDELQVTLPNTCTVI
ncbi:uncharacterized protein LOC126081591 [Elephas maximus indicus]|uniref:uncharacterized protein LOC126081591 n=1 Tax=Elephas maximus indicus TaxID=99487 RepID=UPI002116667A|nr:uncharacterized protein LOC126081591 [Elephas maximus indicus]